MDDVTLTPEQEQHADVLFRRLEELYRAEARRVARLLASRTDEQLLGKTEFQLRDGLHRLGASSLQTALDERKKGDTAGPA